MGKNLTIKIPKDMGILIVLGLLLTMSIINRNEFGAAIAFMYAPVGITLIYYLFLINYKKQIKKHHVLLLLIFIVSSFSTIVFCTDLSSVVSPILASFLWILMCSLLTSVKYDKKTIVRILNIYTVIAVFLCINTLFSVAIGMISGSSFRVITTIFGVRKDNNFYASFLTPVFAYSCFRFVSIPQNRFIFLTVSVLMFLAIFFTGSRAAFISLLLIVGVIITGFVLSTGVSAKKIIILLLLTCAVIGVYSYISTTSLFLRLTNTSEYSTDIRLSLWGEALKAFKEHPIFGAGRGAANRYTYNALGNYVHNTYLEILCDQGSVGMLLFFALFSHFVRVKPENVVFMIVLCIGFFLPFLFISSYQTCGFWMDISICVILSDCLRENNIHDLFGEGKSV